MNIISSPLTPFWSQIPNGLHPGTVIQIDGHIPSHSNKFEVCLVYGSQNSWHHSHSNHVGLKIKANVRKGQVVLNSRQHHHWGNKERHHVSHFRRGSNFTIVIGVQHDSYSITINGQHLSNFSHRIPLHNTATIHIDGNVQINRIEFKGNNYASYSSNNYMSYPSNTVHSTAPNYPLGPVAPPTSYLHPYVAICPQAPTGYVPPTMMYENQSDQHYPHSSMPANSGHATRYPGSRKHYY